MKDIKSFTLEELISELKTIGEPSFRAKQIFTLIFINNFITDIDFLD